MTFRSIWNLNLALLVSCSVLFFSSCSNSGSSSGYSETAHGVKYKIITDNKQPKAKAGDYVQFYETIRDINDALIPSLNVSRIAVIGQASSGDEKGNLSEVFNFIGKGDSVSCIASVEDIMNGISVPGILKKGDNIKLEIKVVDVFSKDEYEAKIAELEQAKIAAADAPALEYIKAHNLNAQRLPSGMYYVTENPGTGAQPVPKKQVTVNYRGTLLDGTEFDSSLKPGRQPFQFVLSAGQVIRGWDEGIPLFKVGGKGILIIPPAMGYGEQGQNNIPPNSWLVFNIEVLGVADAPQQMPMQIPTNVIK